MAATEVRGSKNSTYRSWLAMRRRCIREDRTYYKLKGIKIDPRWLDYFAFLEDMGKRPDGHTIDRINPNADYSKANCRWATAKTQQNNRTNNVKIELNGDTKTVAGWSEVLGISASTIYDRIRRGWDAKSALQTPLKRNFRGNQWTPKV